MVEKCSVNVNCKRHQLVVFETVGLLSWVSVDLLLSLHTGPINVPLKELFKWESIIHSLERKVSEIPVLNIISLGVWLLNTELHSLRQNTFFFFKTVMTLHKGIYCFCLPFVRTIEQIRQQTAPF